MSIKGGLNCWQATLGAVHEVTCDEQTFVCDGWGYIDVIFNIEESAHEQLLLPIPFREYVLLPKKKKL